MPLFLDLITAEDQIVPEAISCNNVAKLLCMLADDGASCTS